MIKKIFITLFIWLSIFSFSENTFSNNTSCNQKEDPFCIQAKTIEEIKWISWEKRIDILIADWVTYLLSFLFLISIVYWLYWAWNIFSAMSDEEKVKKWKTIIIRACIWLVVIFSAYMITDFVINKFLFVKEQKITTSSWNTIIP